MHIDALYYDITLASLLERQSSRSNLTDLRSFQMEIFVKHWIDHNHIPSFFRSLVIKEFIFNNITFRPKSVASVFSKYFLIW